MSARLGRRGFIGGAATLSAALWAPRFAHAASAMGFDDARHLLSRTSFGATPAEIQALEPLDFVSAVDRLLARSHRAETPNPRWVNDSPSVLREQRQASADKKDADGKPVNLAAQLVREQGRELRNWWVDEMLVTDQPLVEKMTLF